MNDKTGTVKKNKKNLAPGRGPGRSSEKKPHLPRTTVDDPENDIFDDEIYEDETVLPKVSPDKSENFEKPW